MNRIELKFDKTINSLAGNDYGYKEYKDQVENKFKWDEKNEIVFPDNIEKIAISFIQGFARDIVEKIDKNKIEDYITVKSSSEYLTDKIISNMKF